MKKFVDNFEQYVIAVLICAMVVFETVNAILHVFGAASVGVPEEVAIYCYVWIAFLCVAFCTKKGCDVTVNMLSGKYSLKAQHTLKIICGVINIFLAVCLFIGAIGFMSSTIADGKVGSLSGIPLAIVYFSSVVGYLLCVARNIEALVGIVKQPVTSKEGN